jgi:hypothetical protein
MSNLTQADLLKVIYPLRQAQERALVAYYMEPGSYHHGCAMEDLKIIKDLLNSMENI